ncbi:MAG: aminotransferase class I/II-fold pyridoxal phosphate-dependent enzyme, partial [candidate division WOR-3 bacterium]
MICLDNNECPWDILKEAKAEIASSIPWNRYPSAEAESSLIRRLGEYLLWEPENILLTNGGDEAILLLTIISSGKVIVSRPGFSVPERIAKALGREVEPVAPRDIPLRRGGLAWLISPHNPLGFMYDQEEITSAAENYGMVGVDCAYWEFSETRPWEGIPDRKNILFIGTFSKAWGIASLRLGYILARDGISA